ncbi:MAG: hypothetical protein A6F70_02625 [Cycloclasticus sp. symbiont of Bathymodiolus heckerae]|nr:MAG: hypothetical protein A6F70_02625 [Cycloclasticus sp. symbiont of Bathymodiolus heckerae]
MPKLTLNSKTYTQHEGDSVLTTLLANHVDIPYACQQGLCQSCLIRSPNQTPPPESQKWLQETQRARNFLLACQCHPTEDMELELDPNEQPFLTVSIVSTKPLSDDIIELIIKHPDNFDFHPGQFINLRRHDGLVRSYSIANCKKTDNTLELHIRKLSDGKFSEWAHQSLNTGDTIEMQGPFGDCFYIQSDPEQPLLLIGTGTGLAPLAGILYDALAQGHTGPIHLYHGSRDQAGLYWVEELSKLANTTHNFNYLPCLSGEEASSPFQSGRAHDEALSDFPDLKNHQIYLCGHPNMVKEAQRKAYLAGAPLHRILADAFTASDSK